ncbi:MAG: winged helix-turn-helix domain-containing protein [Terriglobales bacterium]|jgi:DNA-binding winged helix-turn-helix (wHTH) protein/tetratricopeptide (TPR) repeat protein
MVGPENSSRLRFGGFVVDLATGELFSRSARVPLQDKPFQILALLLRRPKQLVSRSEIIRTVWPGLFIEGDLCLNVAIRRLRSALQDDTANPRFVETVGSHGYRFIAAVHGAPASEPAPTSGGRPRLAVFPLKCLMELEADSLPPSMTEQVITQLRRIDPPFVIITPEFTTEHSPKGKSTMTLCRKVAADYVLVGAISGAGGQARVTVRLLNCHSQACVWAESYTMPADALFAGQEETSRKIAASVVRSLPFPLHPSHLHLVFPAAHENYVQGSHFLSRLTELAIERSIPLFQDAVREYPQFAMAWAALANAHCVQARMGVVPSRKAFPELKSCAEKASEIEDLPETRTALAYYHLLYEHDWSAAEAALVRALAMDPGCAPALGAYAQLLAIAGKHEDAVAMMRRACDLAPFSGYTAVMLGWALYYAGDYEAALSQLKHAMELDASLWVGRVGLGMVLDQMGRTDEAIAEFTLAVEHSDNSALTRAHLAYGLARRGDKAGAAEILDSLLSLRRKHYFSAYWIAVIHTALDDRLEALKWLETAKAEHCSWFVFAHEDPKFAVLRSDAQFQRLMEEGRVVSSA